MRIGIDCSNAIGERTGTGQYTFNLVSALSKIDKKNRYLLYPFFYYVFNNNYKEKAAELPNTDNFKIAFKKIPFPAVLLRRLWIEKISAGLKEFMLGKVDIVHSTTFCAPKFKNKKKRLVETIYDLTVLTHPECHQKHNVDHCLKGIRNAINYADALIAISEHTKNDLINYLNAPPELITVTPLAADPDYREITDSSVLGAVRKKCSLPQNFVLFVGSLEPRKNVRTLLKSYAALPENIKKEFSLVIAGASGWLNSDIPALVKELRIEDITVFPGFIDKGDLNALYSAASLFVYPSLYEGFGLPILEAMACGTPVITSNTSSMPEVAGDAARLIDPTDTDELASALEDILTDEAIRNKMRKKGLDRASLFSWEKCARETLAVYEKVYANPRRV